MNWWGKLIGGTFGLLAGGPIGLLLGAALGNYFDTGIKSLGESETLRLGDTQRVQSAFFTTTFSVMGYLAKADGRVTQDEIRIAEQVMQQMQLTATQRQVAMKLFNAGKAPDFPLQEILDQFRREVMGRRSLVRMFLEILVATAFADGSLHAREEGLLEDLAAKLGYSHEEFAALLSRLTGQVHFQERDSITERLSAAYQLLGVAPGVTEAELKKAYRRHMSQHHPDKLVAKGLPEEMMEIATQRTQDIKAAYELIRSNSDWGH